ncbi:MAG: flagellar biosynthetic protein FliO [Treponema sp.]|nr:flagellar biosynthetic protein FliO [Treponema sp.]
MAFVLFQVPLYAQSQNESDSSSSQNSEISASDLERSIKLSSSAKSNLQNDGESAALTRANSSSGIGIFFRMVVALVIIVVLIYLVFYFVKKKSNVITNDDDYLRRVAALNVAPGKSVQVVTLIDKAYLIGVTEDSISLLGEVNDDELIKAMNLNADKKANVKKPATFTEVLDMFLVKTGKQKSVFADTEQNVQFESESESEDRS